ncbi:MAG: ATP-binding protein [Methylococcales bacterium]|nr:ATP-binding protein [Methylococcales bacterium]
MNAVLKNHISHQSDAQKMLYLTLKNKSDELNKLNLWINNDIATLFKLSENVVFKIDLTLTELIANIISYGYPNQCESEINIKCQCLNDIIKIEVDDTGIPFNPLEILDIILPKSLEEADIGGLGIFMIRKYIDESSYQRENNKNIFTMQFKI